MTRLIPHFAEFEEGPRFLGMKPGVDDGYGKSYVPFEEVYALQSQLDEERAIVSRIWAMFGNPAYEFLDGRSIYDLIQDGLDAVQLLSKYREWHIQSNGQQCYVDITQGDYRCADCVEADRITGMQRKLNEMSAARVARLRESLAQPNNGLA